MGRVVTAGRLGGVMVSTLAEKARDVRSIPVLGTPIFPIFVTSHNTDCPDHNPELVTRCVVIESMLCMYM